MLLKLQILSILAIISFHVYAADLLPLSMAETLLVKQDYRAANALLDDHLKKMPFDNKALYLRMAVRQTELMDYESYLIHKDPFIKLADSTRTVLEGRLGKLKGKDSVECLFFIASILGGTSVVEAKVGNWFPALKNAIASVAMLKEVRRIDPGMHPAFLGTGVFHYYRRQGLKWLPFKDKQGEMEGIRDIEKATQAPFPYGFAAKNSLCWILIERREYARADSLAATVLADAPDNTIFLRIRSLSTLLDKKYDQAIVFGEKLKALSLARTPVNWSDLVMAGWVSSSANYELGKKREARGAAEFLLGCKIPSQYRQIPPVKKNLKKIELLLACLP